jgi:hypothetical protein
MFIDPYRLNLNNINEYFLEYIFRIILDRLPNISYRFGYFI